MLELRARGRRCLADESGREEAWGGGDLGSEVSFM